MVWGTVAFGGNEGAAQKPSGEGADDFDPSAPVQTKLAIDLDGDRKPERVLITYAEGISNKPLTIEIYRGKEKAITLKNRFGIQANYRIADVDGDGKKEIVIWEGLWDPRLKGEDGVKEAEGHSAPHRQVVVTYKLIRGEYALWEAYTTKKKYEPYCAKQPAKD